MSRGKVTIAAIGAIIDRTVIKEMIQAYYKRNAAEQGTLRSRKRRSGYCGGSPSCMEFTGDKNLCSACQKNKDNPRYKKPVYEYGKIRAAEKKKERESKKHEKSHAEPARRRKAA